MNRAVNRSEEEVARFDNVGLRYGTDREVLSDLSFTLFPGRFYFLTGASGAGKTSLLKLLVEELEPNAGTVHWTRGVRVGYVPQIQRAFSSGSLNEEVMTAFETQYFGTLLKGGDGNLSEAARRAGGDREQDEVRPGSA